MAEEIPEHRISGLEEALYALKKANNVILTTHINADGDGTGSEVALALWLRSLGIEVSIINPTPYPKKYEFMLFDNLSPVPASSGDAIELTARADLGVVVDTGEVSRIGRVKPLLDPLRKVVIDHHPTGEHPIPGIEVRDPQACATGELIYDLLALSGDPWPDGVALALYTAILTDTGSFRFQNTSPRCHRVVGDLIDRGVDPQEVHRRLYGSAPLRHLRLLQASLVQLDVDDEGLVGWMTVPQEAMISLSVEPDDFEGLVDYPRLVEGVEVGLLFRQTADGFTKISLRSNGEVNVNLIAREFGGGGHIKASGALVQGEVEQVRSKVVESTLAAVRRQLTGQEPSKSREVS